MTISLLGATPGGAPYPDPADLVKDGAVDLGGIGLFFDPAQMEISRATFNAATGMWTNIGNWATQNFKQGDIEFTTSGVKVKAAGRYLIQAMCNYIQNANPSKRVGIGVGLTGAANPNSRNVVMKQTSVTTTAIQITTSISLAVDNTVSSLVYQDSGATMQVSTAYLCVARIA